MAGREGARSEAGRENEETHMGHTAKALRTVRKEFGLCPEGNGELLKTFFSLLIFFFFSRFIKIEE